MGEVYRAEDLSLGQSVALKFLPDSVAVDADRLARFRTEVSVARQVSHPNVCRVYDIGEADGHVFLSMEYVDGEDLASLLRRIGRLSPDKAAEMARQLCAGLAAAHDKGVLHRDLKPANVMIDGRGRVRLADFGLAGGAEVETPGLAGTPAYMAPEQFAGQAASVKSDIYALGLVLYEMFTGKAAFSGVHGERPGAPASRSDPDQPDAGRRRDRPGRRSGDSALPGQGPCRPSVVGAGGVGGAARRRSAGGGAGRGRDAVAGTGGGLGRRRRAAAGDRRCCCFCAVILALVPVVLLSQKTQVVHYLPLERSPDVLADAAHQIVDAARVCRAGRRCRVGLHADRFSELPARRTDQTLDALRAAAIGPAARRDVLVSAITGSPCRPTRSWLGGTVTLEQPAGACGRHGQRDARPEGPPALPAGRAGATARIPDAPAAAPDWPALLREAGFDAATFTAVTPKWVPPVFADARAAWTGATRIGPTSRSASKPRPGGAAGLLPDLRAVERDTLGGPGGRQRVTAAAVLAFSLFCAVVHRCVPARAAQPAPQSRRRGRGVQAGAGALPDARRRRADDGASDATT